MEKYKDFLSVSRDTILLLLFLFLIFFPNTINRILVNAGFTEISVMGATWKQKALDSKQLADSSRLLAETAGTQMEEMQNRLDSISKKLVAIAQSTNNPEVHKIAAAIDSSKLKLMLNSSFLKKSTQAQKTKLDVVFKSK